MNPFGGSLRLPAVVVGHQVEISREEPDVWIWNSKAELGGGVCGRVGRRTAIGVSEHKRCSRSSKWKWCLGSWEAKGTGVNKGALHLPSFCLSRRETEQQQNI